MKPILVEKFTDNGEHSHWELINNETGIILWSNNDHPPASLQSLIERVEGLQFSSKMMLTPAGEGYNEACNDVIDILKSTPCIKAKAMKEKGNNDRWLKYSNVHQAWIESKYPIIIFGELPLVPTFAELIDIEILIKP